MKFFQLCLLVVSLGFFSCMPSRSLSVSYEAGLYRLGVAAPRSSVRIECIDNREKTTVGSLLTNGGFKIGNLFLEKTYIQAWKKSLEEDLSRCGFHIDESASSIIRFEIDEIESTFVYESFRPTSKANVAMTIKVFEKGELTFTKQYSASAPATYFITGSKIAGKGTSQALSGVLKKVIADRAFTKAIDESLKIMTESKSCDINEDLAL